MDIDLKKGRSLRINDNDPEGKIICEILIKQCPKLGIPITKKVEEDGCVFDFEERYFLPVAGLLGGATSMFKGIKSIFGKKKKKKKLKKQQPNVEATNGKEDIKTAQIEKLTELVTKLLASKPRNEAITESNSLPTTEAQNENITPST